MEKLNIGYLYSAKFGKNQESFVKIAKENNLDITFLDISKFPEEKDMIEMQKCDIIFNDSGDGFAFNFIKILEELGKLVVESSKGVKQENKWNTYKICKQNEIPCPKSILLSEDLDVAEKQLEEFKEWPLILKRVTGTWGEYVQKANNLDEAIETMKRFWEKGQEKIPILAQEFVDSFSYRVTYICDEIVQTAIKENNNWKCTGVYARNFKKFEIDSELNEIVKKIMKNFDIKVCGIDLLKKDNHWSVIEVNSEPALDFFEDETERLIEKIIDLLIKLALEDRNKKRLLEIPIKQKIKEE